MKKLHSLFILSILALTMFVGCQMPTEDVTYRVNVAENTYKDNVSVDNATPKAGDTVVITITVPADFSADDLKLSVMKNKEAVTVTDVESTETNKVKKSFTMPESDVTVTVNFEKKATPTETPTETPTDTTPTDTTPTNTTPTDTTPTDDTGNEETEDPVDDKPTDTTPTVDADEATYGFTKTFNYTVVANGQSLPETKTGAELIAIAKEKKMVKDTDYTINGTTVTLTASGVGKYLGGNDDNTSSGGDTLTDDTSSDDTTEENPTPNPTETTSETYSIFARARDGYRLDNTSSESGKEVELPIMTSEGNTPTGLYLVNVRIEDKSTGNDIKSTVNLKIEDNKIKFTMPSSNVDVYASFEGVTFKKDYNKNNNGRLNVTTEKSNNSDFDIGLRFTEKVFDNLEYIGGVYVLRVASKTALYEPKDWDDTHWLYQCTIETTYTEHVLCAIVGEEVKIPSNHKIDL